MGIVFGVVNGIINLVHTVKENKKKDKLDQDIVKKKDIVKPIAPPKYYSTIEARRKNVKDGPYSVEGIAYSLKNDLIPVGYSLEQLRKIGFGADVDEYEKRHKQIRTNDNKNLIDALEKLKKEIKKGFVDRKDLSEEDREIINKNKLFNPEENQKYVDKLNSWIDLAKKDLLSVDVLDSMLSIFNNKLDGYSDALRTNDLEKRNKQLVDNAILNRDKKVLDSVKRAFANGYGIKKF